MLDALSLTHFRNISQFDFQFHSKVNVLIGDNGVGKTSTLEAIYCLSSGHSFRTRETLPLINRNASHATVFGRLERGDTIGIERPRQGKIKVKINGAFCRSNSELAHLLPTLVMHQDIFQIIDAGPAVRRHLLDWGVFHVEHEYLFHWKQYHRALKQRNSLLKRPTSEEELLPWTKLLVEHGELITQFRVDYFKRLEIVFIEVLNRISALDCTLSLHKGWDKSTDKISLEQCFRDTIARDMKRGFTQQGPHQADVIIESHQAKAKSTLSRGQQKLVLMALKIAQTKLLNKKLIILLDDLAAELDMTSREALANELLQCDAQLVLTAIDEHQLPPSLIKANPLINYL